MIAYSSVWRLIDGCRLTVTRILLLLSVSSSNVESYCTFVLPHQIIPGRALDELVLVSVISHRC